jgi:hypothetical protein
MKNTWCQFNQWCRRVFIRYYGWTIHDCIYRLRQEQDWLTSNNLRTDLDSARLKRINWLLGEST